MSCIHNRDIIIVKYDIMRFTPEFIYNSSTIIRLYVCLIQRCQKSDIANLILQ